VPRLSPPIGQARVNEPLPALIRRAAALQKERRSAVACLVVRSRGSTPQTAGALMLVDDAAGTYGTIGGGCVEAEVRRRAFEMLGAGRSGVLRFKLDHDYGWDDGLICGGTIEVAVARWPEAAQLERIAASVVANEPTALPLIVEATPIESASSADCDVSPSQREGAGGWASEANKPPQALGATASDGSTTTPAFTRPPALPPTTFSLYTLRLPPRERLLIAGAGHVGQALARLALRLDFEVAIYDDRPDLLERFAPPEAVKVAGPIAANLREARIDAATYAVVVTRGHRHDQEALHAVIDRGARYVGMIGSRRKVKLITDGLREAGVPDAALKDLHAPIGLDIGSVTVEEIAVSIAAQLVQVRRADKVALVEGPTPLVSAAPSSKEPIA
jgi:xanthine dehydrogenase accessory factor